MNRPVTLKAVCTGLAIYGAMMIMGCGKKEEVPPSAPPGQPSSSLQNRLNDPNISPEIKEKMKAAASPSGGK